MSNQIERKAISLDEMRLKAQGTLVEIPDWTNNGTIDVRVKAIDMTPHIMSIDKMPNALKKSAVEAFEGKAKGSQADLAKDISTDDMEHMLPIIEGVVKEVLVEPTYDDFQEIYPLTLQQKLVLFKMSMGGIEELDSFRTEPK